MSALCPRWLKILALMRVSRERRSVVRVFVRRVTFFTVLVLTSVTAVSGTADAQGIESASTSQSQEAEWKRINDSALEAFQRGNFSNAIVLAKQALVFAESVFGSDHPDTLVSVISLAALYSHQGRYSEAEPLYIRALDGRQRVLGKEHRDTLESVNGLALLYVSESRFAEAEPLYLREIEVRERVQGKDHPETLATVGLLAALYQYQHRFTEAEPLNLRVLATFERLLGREDPNTLSALNNLAALYGAQGRYAEAEPLYQRALEVNERLFGKDDPKTLTVVANTASLYVSQGRYGEAEPLFIRALNASERVLGKEHPQTLNIVHSLADVYETEGRLGKAERLYIRALEGLQRVFGKVNPQTANIALGLSMLRLSTPAAASAIEPARIAVTWRRASRDADESGFFADAQRGRDERQGAVYAVVADAAWAASRLRGDADGALAAESFTALQDATTGTTSRAVLEMAVRHIADDKGAGLGGLIRERQTLVDGWATNSKNYSAALANPGTDADALKQRLKDDRELIEMRMDAIDASLRRDFPQYFSLVRPEPLDLAATQAMLEPDEAILLVVPTPFGTHVMAVDYAGIDWQRSTWPRSTVDQVVGILMGDIRATMADEKYSYQRHAAYDLYGQIVAPVATRLAGKRHVFIVSGGSLSSLPFGVLVTGAPEGADDDPQALKATHWFADAHALIQLPSIQSLQFLRKYGRDAGRSDPASTGFVGFGNPTLEGPLNHPERCTRGGRGGPTAASVASGLRTRSGGMRAEISVIRQLCPLPGTAAELENMRTAFGAPPASLHLAAQSTERAIRTIDLSRARVVALATHGLVAGEIEGATEPGLVFTPPTTPSDEDDGFLTASEVSAMRLDADWIILSACNTAAGDGSAGAPGLSGLARAFFYAGARNLLASHWPVADDAAALLTVRTIQLARDNPGLSRAQALQQSMRAVRDDASHPAWAHPGVWAPFSLIGDGAR